MSKKINSALLIFILSPFFVLSQSLKDLNMVSTNRVYVQYSDSIVETHYYSGDKKIKEKDNLIYYWYAASDIKHTRGAYQGKILHGECVVFYNNKDLLAKGYFTYGVKTGTWKYWYKGGELKSKEVWKQGLLHGARLTYDEKQNILIKRFYKQGVLHGWVYYYKDGILIEKEFFQKNKSIKKEFYTLNSKGKYVKSPKDKSSQLEKSKSPAENKKVKTDKVKKNKKSNIKIQRFQEVQPGGQGA